MDQENWGSRLRHSAFKFIAHKGKSAVKNQLRRGFQQRILVAEEKKGWAQKNIGGEEALGQGRAAVDPGEIPIFAL